MIFKLNFDSSTPIYVQLRNEIVLGIGLGKLKPNEGLPTVRQMAEDIGVNAMTVNKAYTILKNEGFISIDRRHGAKVNVSIPDNAEVEEKLESELALIISEAGLKGVSKKDFIDICNDLFKRMNGINKNLVTD
ncbi:MAG: GntR family transcriptional regulator [Clostridium sp.]|nr:GntR family transcriptional regulator [Clostridium sp.]